ncbi:Glutamate decarboxylase [Vigna angularis]|uniref:Glutamate decarboxylase n=1 Tax=Phaseolus angularis TaxID=3914 RepID=A0A8T0JT02_PHAAN|nr:Glutamate decarboxylase [Vigna angularis]
MFVFPLCNALIIDVQGASDTGGHLPSLYSVLPDEHIDNGELGQNAHLFHAEIGEDGNVVGARTVGSSEAMMLAGLAFKNWQNKHKAKRLEASNLSLVLHLGLMKPWP